MTPHTSLIKLEGSSPELSVAVEAVRMSAGGWCHIVMTILTYVAGQYPTRVSSYRSARDAPQDYVCTYSHIRCRSVPGICREVGID